jgi:transcriptional antiterminator
MEQVQEQNDWLNPKAIANYLGVSLSQVYLDMSKVPPPYPFYRVTTTRRLAKRTDLDVYLEQRKVSAGATSES